MLESYQELRQLKLAVAVFRIRGAHCPTRRSSIVETGCPGVEKTILDSGVRIVTETMPHVRSVAIGVWVDTGSRYESEEESGISHFTEHMVFKGTDNLSAEEIAFAADAIGGNLDAFTTKENVAYTAKVLDEHLPRACEIISDLVLRPKFQEEDIIKEKGVVLEELKMEEDNPEYQLSEIFSVNFWQNHPLGRPIIGNRRSIRNLQRQQLQAYFQRAYEPGHLVVTAAGNLNHNQVVDLIAPDFQNMKPVANRPKFPQAQATPSVVLKDKPSLEQVHLCLGVPTYPMTDERRFAGYLLNTLLGGGVSSRLFLKVRENEGLVYTIFSDLSLYSDTGCLVIYAGTSLERIGRVTGHITSEFREMKEQLVSPEELRRAKDHLKGSLMLSLESTSSRMSNLARQEKYFGKITSLDSLNEKIENVRAEEIREYASDCFRPERIAVTVLGPLDGYQLDRAQLDC